ncbi:SUMO-targeted ubiquitin ligase complex subunit SLX8 SCDLUD_000149 [Saccharomycodes ludwigii]|nr:hypothetical protein SCDLUD_000149 [Saccharomycodes ludwigii]KAH3902569.1 hypothetical protein SCDLUD_000149 [Saccharomycodes ludwigii]
MLKQSQDPHNKRRKLMNKNKNATSKEGEVEAETSTEDMNVVTEEVKDNHRDYKENKVDPTDLESIDENDIKNQQLVEIVDDDEIEIIEKPQVPEENLKNSAGDIKKPNEENKSLTEYKCPICFEPPSAAVITICGHVFCTECLFQMLNSSRTHRKPGVCALCRTQVPLNKFKLIIMRKRTIKKKITKSSIGDEN